MPARFKPQRIRDPVHNLIEFGGDPNRWSDPIEQVLWRVIETPPFQRLRRIRQLGFSEFVYPGATHTRFAHSLGVFHTARQLMTVIERHIRLGGGDFKPQQANTALAAALVHDVGHGMFSHAFEEVGKQLSIKMARHENVSELLIRDSEISEVLKKEMGSGFADDVANVIGRGRPGNLYDAVVSSQFDADRLDYMQRDRLMTGVHNSGIDLVWLQANLQIGKVPVGADEQQTGTIDTFVLGPKAGYAAETYVLALFQLYPTIYFHKATRAAEKVFSALMQQFFKLVRDGQAGKTGLPQTHPIIRFATEPDSLRNALALDDTVFLGALPMLVEAPDPLVASFASRLWERRLPKCIDVLECLNSAIKPYRATSGEERDARRRRIERSIVSIEEKIQAWLNEKSEGIPRVLMDRTSRDCYKRFQDSKGPLDQIRLRRSDGDILDMAEGSRVIAGIDTFTIFRAYYSEGDDEARKMVEDTIEAEVRRNGDGK